MSQSRFDQKFAEQIGYLQRSAKHYDDGHEDEALRLATSLRVLLHDTPASISLFNHTGRTGERLLTSSRGFGNWKDYLAHHLVPTSSDPIRMQPLLGDQFHELAAQDWWSTEPVFIHDGVTYTRKVIVLSAANKDGGAHVDAKLQSYYKVLQAGEYAIGFTRETHPGGNAPTPLGVTVYPNNAHLALLRQFAHEMLESAKHYGWHVF
ncbi:hypothetical protein ACFWAY_44330 [Rhodococcus sp. NPDC059968]|uniref:hypothetical protein n=1 Tax=Rhodococcus sp. NPDC059968 TaxID=3347017 RepID=UPI00366C8C7E